MPSTLSGNLVYFLSIAGPKADTRFAIHAKNHVLRDHVFVLSAMTSYTTHEHQDLHMDGIEQPISLYSGRFASSFA